MAINFEIRKLDPNEINLAGDLILMFGFDDENGLLPSDEYVA